MESEIYSGGDGGSDGEDSLEYNSYKSYISDEEINKISNEEILNEYSLPMSFNSKKNNIKKNKNQKINKNDNNDKIKSLYSNLVTLINKNWIKNFEISSILTKSSITSSILNNKKYYSKFPDPYESFKLKKSINNKRSINRMKKLTENKVIIVISVYLIINYLHC